jgi:2-polyprenyl-3-methyl-5-hydroxy-6-metoxy-1,4-benzoquinol methylase
MNISNRILHAMSRLALRNARHAAKPYKDDESNREAWVRSKLKAIPAGSRILDVGAGECRFKADCGHLSYTSQDVAQYDGKGDGHGLQTGTWDFSKIDIVCDLHDIPEENPYDCLLCTEVLEHVPDAPRSISKFARLLKPNGQLILTAPFACLVHFAPYFFSSGYSEYFYREHLVSNGFICEEIKPNCSYFRQVHSELSRVTHVAANYTQLPLSLEQARKIADAAEVMRELIDSEESLVVDGAASPSAALSSHGFLVLAKKESG